MTTQPPAAGPATRRAGKTGTDGRWAARVVPWVAQVGVAVILAQTLFFKFTYAPETRYIFESRGGQPAATLVGLAELVCVVLLLIPRTAAVGAALALAVIGGAVTTHPPSPGGEGGEPGTRAGGRRGVFWAAVGVWVRAPLPPS